MAANTVTGTTADGLTVTVLVEPAPPSDERIHDMSELWALFIAASVAIFCLRRLMDLFRIDQSD